MVEFVTMFIGSANVDVQKIINIMEQGGNYIIPIHEFWKAALLGEYSYYDPQSSLAFDLFDIRNADQNEHFLVPMITRVLKFRRGSQIEGWFRFFNICRCRNAGMVIHP